MTEEYDIQDLIQAYLDGTAAPDQLALLRDRVKGDREAAKALLKAAAMDHALAEHYGEGVLVSGFEDSLFPPGERAVEEMEAAYTHSLFNPRSASRWLPLAALLMALLGGFLLKRNGGQVRISSCDPGIIVVRGEQHVNAEEGADLRRGDRLIIPDHLQASFEYRDGTRISVRGFSKIRLDSRGHAKRFSLASGYLLADVAPQHPRYPLTVRTPHSEIRVRGTRFLLNVQARDSRLEVENGHVEIKQGNLIQDVFENEVAVAVDGVLQRTVYGRVPKDPADRVLYEENFAEPVDPRWRGGVYYSHDLPFDSPGAFRVLLAQRPARRPHIECWFPVKPRPIYLESDAFFHVRYRCRESGPIELRLGTSLEDGNVHAHLVFHLDHEGSDEWKDVYVPLAAFDTHVLVDQRVIAGRFDKYPLWADEFCHMLRISPRIDMELVVDHIRLVRGS